jgi:hypothetical protein
MATTNKVTGPLGAAVELRAEAGEDQIAQRFPGLERGELGLLPEVEWDLERHAADRPFSPDYGLLESCQARQ